MANFAAWIKFSLIAATVLLFASAEAASSTSGSGEKIVRYPKAASVIRVINNELL